VEFLWNTEVKELVGDDHLECIRILDNKEHSERMLDLDGLFIAVGTIPNTGIVTNLLQLDANGYICAGEDGVTEIPGIIAAGDLRHKQLRQIVTAVSDGANAITSAQNYLRKH
jgi:thioredoxin reductase (NADPH)